jgi:hypothetical protein
MTDSKTTEEASRRAQKAVAELDHALRAEERRSLETELERRRAHAGHLSGTDASVTRLRHEVELLRAHHAAIEASRVWRTAQFLRRLLGRSW